MSLSLARLALMILALVLSLGQRISAAQPTGEAAPAPRLYAAEIQVGTGWDPAKPAQDQTHFAEHSANIRRLRESGALRFGARYGDKGLLVLWAESEAAAHAMLAADASFAAGTFRYQLSPFNPFHWGADPRIPEAAGADGEQSRH